MDEESPTQWPRSPAQPVGSLLVPVPCRLGRRIGILSFEDLLCIHSNPPACSSTRHSGSTLEATSGDSGPLNIYFPWYTRVLLGLAHCLYVPTEKGHPESLFPSTGTHSKHTKPPHLGTRSHNQRTFLTGRWRPPSLYKSGMPPFSSFFLSFVTLHSKKSPHSVLSVTVSTWLFSQRSVIERLYSVG